MALKKCRICGTEIPEDLIGGLCPRCVLEQAMQEIPEAADEEIPAPPPSEQASTKLSPPAEVTEPVIPDHHPGERIGRYKLLEKIGEGSVWLAEQTESVRRMVALKVIQPGMDSAQVPARFEAERQALALLDHPNIAKVLDAGATPTGRPYFVMDLVKGVSATVFVLGAGASKQVGAPLMKVRYDVEKDFYD